MNTRIIAIAIIVFILAADIAGAQAPPRQPDSGTIMKEQTREGQEAPKKGASPVELEETHRPSISAGSGLRMTPKRFTFTGDLLLSKTELDALSLPYVGKELGFEGLNRLCDDITAALRQKGYAVALAYLPQQEIRDGIVEIALIGGRYGNIILDNSSGIRDSAIRREMTGIKPGEFITTRGLERAALLVNDLSGADVGAILSAGKKVGTSDLTLAVKPEKRMADYHLAYDNYGNYSVGTDQLGISALWKNPCRMGDDLRLRVNTGGFKGLLLGALAYRTPFGSNGGKLELSYSHVNYTLGKSFESLNATGTARVAGVNWSYPLQRIRLANVNLTIGYDNAALGNVQTNPAFNQQQALNRGVLSLSGDFADRSSVNAWYVSYTAGTATMQSRDAETADVVLQSAGGYGKLSYAFLRNQRLADRLSLLIRVNGQTASKNLVSFEDLSLGGPYGVRAYGVGESTGDIGHAGTAELRWAPPGAKNLQLAAFYDIGNITYNANPWAGQGNNQDTLSGYGTGFIWSRSDDFSLNASYAWRITGRSSTIGDNPDTNGRLWVSTKIRI